MLTIRIDRDSVHAGDDLEPHTQTVAAGPDLSLGVLLQQIRSGGYLPGIVGGQATWIVRSSADSSRPIGVLAQQWPQVELLVPADVSVREHFGESAPSLYFSYWCQASPRLVLEAIRDGKALPARF
jgi:hypothetical protein